MLGAALFVPAVVAGALWGVFAFAPLKLQIGVGLSLLIGVAAAGWERMERHSAGQELAPADAPALHGVVERLCVAADLPKPRIVREPERQPNSWVVGLGRGRARLHVTQGLLDRLSDAEIEAVVAHELAHIAHRDATVMTVVGGPASAMIAGGARLASEGSWFLMFGSVVAVAIGWLGSLGTRALSRYREFAADAGAAALTGSPSALASALVKVSDGIVAIPHADLRAVAGRDAFHLLPTGWQLKFAATHPPLQARIERLERIEARLQSAR